MNRIVITSPWKLDGRANRYTSQVTTLKNDGCFNTAHYLKNGQIAGAGCDDFPSDCLGFLFIKGVC